MLFLHLSFNTHTWFTIGIFNYSVIKFVLKYYFTVLSLHSTVDCHHLLKQHICRCLVNFQVLPIKHNTVKNISVYIDIRFLVVMVLLQIVDMFLLIIKMPSREVVLLYILIHC